MSRKGLDLSLREQRLPDLIAAPALPIAEVALLFDVPLSTLDKMRAEGRGPRCLRIGKRLFVRQQDIRAWLDRLATEDDDVADACVHPATPAAPCPTKRVQRVRGGRRERS